MAHSVCDWTNLWLTLKYGTRFLYGGACGVGRAKVSTEFKFPYNRGRNLACKYLLMMRAFKDVIQKSVCFHLLLWWGNKSGRAFYKLDVIQNKSVCFHLLLWWGNKSVVLIIIVLQWKDVPLVHALKDIIKLKIHFNCSKCNYGLRRWFRMICS